MYAVITKLSEKLSTDVCMYIGDSTKTTRTLYPAYFYGDLALRPLASMILSTSTSCECSVC